MSFSSKFKIYLIAIGVGILALIGLYAKGKSDGKTSEKNKQMEDKLNAVKKANKARADLRKPGAVNKLRRKYTR